MIKDFRKELPDVKHQLRSGKHVLVYMLREHEYNELRLVYRNSEKVKELFGINANQIVVFGDTAYPPDTSVISRIVDKTSITHNGHKVNLYTCFNHVGREYDDKAMIMHQSVRDSFKCIMDIMVKPKYIIILKIHNKDINNFRLTEI